MLRHPLARDIVKVVAIKIAALCIIYFAVIAPARRPIDAASHIAGASAAQPANAE